RSALRHRSPGGAVSGEPDGGGALHAPDRRPVTDIQIHLAFELEGAANDRARSNHYARGVLGPEPDVKRAGVLLDVKAAVDVCVGTDFDVARHCVDETRDVSGRDPYGAVDIAQRAGDVRAVGDRHGAVDRLNAAGDAHRLFQVNGPVDGHEFGRRGVSLDGDAAVDGVGPADHGILADMNGSVYRRDIPAVLTCANVDGAHDFGDRGVGGARHAAHRAPGEDRHNSKHST